MATPWNSAADRRRPTGLDGVVALAILALALLSLLLLLRGGAAAGGEAVVTADGRELARIDLEENGRYPLSLEHPLTLLVENGSIRVAQSSCPGGDCLRTGAISRRGQSIVCLPNRLVISVTGAEHSQVDGITG